MPKLIDLVSETAKGNVQIGGSTVEFTFYVMPRERFSQDEWDALLAMKGREYLRVLLPKVLISWDITDADGTMISPSAEAFDQHKIPDVLLFAIERRLFQSDLSGKVTSSSSPGS